MAQGTSGTPSPVLGIAGPVILIGGAEDKRRDKVILSRFVELAGGPNANIVVISTASTFAELAAERYVELFSELGAGVVTGVRPLSREEANDPATVAPLATATGAFLTGGNQVRLISTVGGTRLEDALASARDRGAAIAGTSAGASAAATHMVAFGRSGASPKHRMIHISAGLGLVDGIIVDQHFEQRGRMGRLLAAVALSPRLIGIGLDEDTAAIIWPDRTLEVIGKGSVTIVDGSQIATDSFQMKGHRPMMVSGAIVHALPTGFRFDLRGRRLIEVSEPEVREASE
ncbi:MAG: cyanophycinase [Actinomycetota bacterium]